MRQANQFGANCIQKLFPSGIEGGPWTKEYVVDSAEPFSEDCLFLNVWTPATTADAKLPVFFWIHGGGFNQGSGSILTHDGAALASRGIIVVSVNYRVGPFGLLAHPELTVESGTPSSGNYTIADLIAGLGWVRDNIAAFGGDPARVTIAGQSAGAGAVHSLVASPLAKGLFAGAIAQSGSGRRGQPLTLDQAEANGEEFARRAGAKTLAELRALSADDVQAVDLSEGLRFRPIVDGVINPLSPSDAQTQGKYNDTPFLTGFTADEGSSSATYGQATLKQLETSIREAYGARAAKVLAAYSAADDAAAAEASKLLARERTLASLYDWAVDRLATSKHPVYAYLYTHPEPGPDAARFGAFHSSDLPYVFNTLDRSPGRTFTDHDHEIANQMGSYWINFIATGDPNGSDSPAWPKVDAENKQIMELGGRFAPRAAVAEEKLALLAAE